MSRLPRSGGRGVSSARALVGGVSARCGGGGRISSPKRSRPRSMVAWLAGTRLRVFSHDACSFVPVPRGVTFCFTPPCLFYALASSSFSLQSYATHILNHSPFFLVSCIFVSRLPVIIDVCRPVAFFHAFTSHPNDLASDGDMIHSFKCCFARTAGRSTPRANVPVPSASAIRTASPAGWRSRTAAEDGASCARIDFASGRCTRRARRNGCPRTRYFWDWDGVPW